MLQLIICVQLHAKKRAAIKLACTWSVQCINYTTQQSSLPFQGTDSQMPNSGNHSRRWRNTLWCFFLLFRIQILAKNLHYRRYGRNQNKGQRQPLFCTAHQSLEMILQQLLWPWSFRMGVTSWTEQQGVVIQVQAS